MNWTESRVMITGGRGFLGRHVRDRLQFSKPKQVFIVDHREYDLTIQTQVARLFKEHPADLVIHLAGLVGGIGANEAYPADFFYRNLMMGTMVLHYAWQSGAKKVVAAGAGCGYPEHAPLPLRETDFWEGFPQAESAPYSLAKRMLHVQAIAYWRQHHFPIVIGIPGNIYGPFDNYDLEMAHVVPALVRRFIEAADSGTPEVVVWGSGNASRDFIYASDAAEGLIRAAERIDGPEIVNLSGGVAISVREIVDNLRAITGYRGAVRWDSSRPDGQAARCFDVSKAKKLLDWQATTRIGEGLKRTVGWYRTHLSEARLSQGVEHSCAS